MKQDLLESIDALLHDVDFVYICRCEEESGDALYRLSYRAGGVNRTEVASTLEKLVYVLSGDTKVCSRCQLSKPLRDFPRRKQMKDGRASHCIECDRKRKAKWYPRAARGRKSTPSAN